MNDIMNIITHSASVNWSYEWFYNREFDLVVEIGTRNGDSTLSLNKWATIKRLVTIDPYLQYEDYEHDGSWETSTDKTYEKTKEVLSYYPNIEMIRGKSSEVVDNFVDESIDFLFIDGNHSYDYVLEDLELYYPKVKRGGVITGDDYFMNKNAYRKKMVQEAVNDFAEKYSLELLHPSYMVDDMSCTPINPRLTDRRCFHGEYPKNWTFIKP